MIVHDMGPVPLLWLFLPLSADLLLRAQRVESKGFSTQKLRLIDAFLSCSPLTRCLMFSHAKESEFRTHKIIIMPL